MSSNANLNVTRETKPELYLALITLVNTSLSHLTQFLCVPLLCTAGLTLLNMTVLPAAVTGLPLFRIEAFYSIRHKYSSVSHTQVYSREVWEEYRDCS